MYTWRASGCENAHALTLGRPVQAATTTFYNYPGSQNINAMGCNLYQPCSSVPLFPPVSPLFRSIPLCLCSSGFPCCPFVAVNSYSQRPAGPWPGSIKLPTAFSGFLALPFFWSVLWLCQRPILYLFQFYASLSS